MTMTANSQLQNIGPALLACFCESDAAQKARSVRQLASQLQVGAFTRLQPLHHANPPGPTCGPGSVGAR